LRLVAGGWFVLREKYYWLVVDKPSEQAVSHEQHTSDRDTGAPNFSECSLMNFISQQLIA
jgi:hypothetical protein